MQEGKKKMTIYNYEEVFQDIPGDSANVMFTFPPEMNEKCGWKEGDIIEIKLEGKSLILTKKDFWPYSDELDIPDANTLI
jgi:hypothetical protein